MATGTELIEGTATEILNYNGNAAALESITRAEIDVQIATAKRFPRSPAAFMEQATSLVSLSPRLAEKCTYALPRFEGGKKKIITGPSVRLAEIVAVSWKNLRIIGRVVADDGKAITAQGVCLDLESNVGYSVEVRRGVTTKDGKRFSGDMVNVTCNAAIAIATRNATFKAVPRALVNIIHETAQEVARGTMESLPARRNRQLDHFGAQGVKDAEVYAVLDVKGWDDLTESHLATLQGFQVALEEGSATLDEIFRPQLALKPEERREGESKTAELARRMKDAKKSPKAADAPPATTPPPVDPPANDDDWVNGQDEE